MDESNVVRALAALAQPVRLQVFRRLVVAGAEGMTPGVLAEALGVPSSSLSFHLKELTHAGLLSQERASRNLIYRAAFERMNELLAYLTLNCCNGAPCAVQPLETPGNRLLLTMDPIYHVLFICTGNSARSILAEALLNGAGDARFRAWSAGSHPRGEVNPLALRELERLRIPHQGLRSKSWDEFAGPQAPRLDFVFTVCDQAAGEVCPYWPGQPVTAHWGMPDPAAVEGPEAVREQAFRATAVTLKRRLDLLRALPVERLDKLALHRKVQEIGGA